MCNSSSKRLIAAHAAWFRAVALSHSCSPTALSSANACLCRTGRRRRGGQHEEGPQPQRLAGGAPKHPPSADARRDRSRPSDRQVHEPHVLQTKIKFWMILPGRGASALRPSRADTQRERPLPHDRQVHRL